jgi:esterase/lipase superfamily enzyme
MTRTKRRLLIGAAVILIAVGGWFYFFYFLSTEAAIRHSEEFQFQRMAVTKVDDENYRFFFVTNRNQDAEGSVVEESFGTEREDTLKFGSYDVSIEPTLGLGMFLDPTEWFQNEEIKINRVSHLPKDDFVQMLKEFVNKSPRRSLLIIVHGFRERFPSALRKTAFITAVLDIDTPVLVFDWPGNQGSSLRGYRQARSVAQTSGAELANTLEIIIRRVKPDHVSLMANSMGGQVVVEAFNMLYESEDLADADTELDHVVLTAPDVDHAEFNARFKNQIKALANDLTVYVSSNDRALLMSRVINRGLRAGESTLSTDQLEEAVSLSRLVEPDSDLINLVDVTPVNRTRNFHNFSLETPEFFDDLFLRLTSDNSSTRNRLVYRVHTPDDTVYWVLTRGR